jgi:PAS domain S-box-containing protein
MRTPDGGVTMTGDSAELCRRIVAATPDAVIFADRAGVIRLWNAGAEALFGYTAAEAVGQTLDLIVPPNLRARHWEGYRRVMETGVTRYGRELLAVPALHKDGRRISLEFSVALLRDEGNELAGITAILRDVTARWERERTLQRRVAELEAAGGGQAHG